MNNDANADTDDDTNAEKKKCRGKKTNAIPDAEAYHSVGKQWMNS